jgi:DnaK suppressor protein
LNTFDFEGVVDVMDQEDLSAFRQRLLHRREEILDFQQALDQSWRNLQERETEPQEAAQKEAISTSVSRLSAREQEELKAIDAALQRIQDGTYGKCASCAKPIKRKRLDVIPWTALCLRCADRGSIAFGDTLLPESGETPVPPHHGTAEADSAKSDEELCEMIYEEIENDGRVPIDTLEISCDDGVVFLKGSVPSQLSHKTLLAVLEDTLHVEEIVDEVEIGGASSEAEGEEETETLAGLSDE